VPTAKDVCLPNGQLAHCAADGAITAEDCPAADPCAQNEYGAACGSPPSGPPAGSGGSGGGGSNGGTSSGSGGTGDSGGSAGTSPGEPGDRGEVLADDSGCACRAGGASSTSGAAWAAALALFFALGRRRASGPRP
jgi:MYXO-CTERM domain-containing protein